MEPPCHDHSLHMVLPSLPVLENMGLGVLFKGRVFHLVFLVLFQEWNSKLPDADRE